MIPSDGTVFCSGVDGGSDHPEQSAPLAASGDTYNYMFITKYICYSKTKLIFPISLQSTTIKC